MATNNKGAEGMEANAKAFETAREIAKDTVNVNFGDVPRKIQNGTIDIARDCASREQSILAKCCAKIDALATSAEAYEAGRKLTAAAKERSDWLKGLTRTIEQSDGHAALGRAAAWSNAALYAFEAAEFMAGAELESGYWRAQGAL